MGLHFVVTTLTIFSLVKGNYKIMLTNENQKLSQTFLTLTLRACARTWENI